jgi:hypothetical protein
MWGGGDNEKNPGTKLGHNLKSNFVEAIWVVPSWFRETRFTQVPMEVSKTQLSLLQKQGLKHSQE